MLVFPVRIPAWVFLGLWFLYQLVEATSAGLGQRNGAASFFAHVGGFLFGSSSPAAWAARHPRARPPPSEFAGRRCARRRDELPGWPRKRPHIRLLGKCPVPDHRTRGSGGTSSPAEVRYAISARITSSAQAGHAEPSHDRLLGELERFGQTMHFVASDRA